MPTATERVTSTVVVTVVSATSNRTVATVAIGLSEPVRSALIWTNATNADTMIMLMIAKSFRSSR